MLHGSIVSEEGAYSVSPPLLFRLIEDATSFGFSFPLSLWSQGCSSTWEKTSSNVFRDVWDVGGKRRLFSSTSQFLSMWVLHQNKNRSSWLTLTFWHWFAPVLPLTLEFRKDDELQYASVDLNECNWNEDDENDILNFVVEKRASSRIRASLTLNWSVLFEDQRWMTKSLRKPMETSSMKLSVRVVMIWIVRKTWPRHLRSRSWRTWEEDVTETSEVEKTEEAVEMKERKKSHDASISQKYRQWKRYIKRW